MDRKSKRSGRDILGYLLLGISVVMLGRSLMLCFSNDIWYDELFTVGMIEHSYGDLIRFTARDVHPPLYYMITKFIVDLCKLISADANAVVIAKIVSVLPYFGLLLYCVTFIRKKFSLFTGGFFLFCIVAMPQLSSYTVEVRMYSWALLFVTAAFLHAYGTVYADMETVEDAEYCGTGNTGSEAGRKAVRARRMHGAALVGYGVAAAYTQYFACVAVVMVYLYVLLVFLLRDRHRIREWFLWTAVSVVCYAPWMFALYRQITAVNDNYWILPLSWRTFGGCVKFLMKPAFISDALNVILAVVLFVIYVGIFGYHIIEIYQDVRGLRRNVQSGERSGDIGCVGNDRDAEKAWNRTGHISRIVFMMAGTGVLTGLVLFGFAASMLIRPIFVYRYMIPAMGCFWLSFAVGMDERWRTLPVSDNGNEKSKIIRIVPVFLVLFVMAIGLRDYRAFMGEEEYKILLMEQVEEALSSIAPEDIVVYNFDQVQAVTSYYLPDEAQSYLWCGTPEILIQEIVRPYNVLEDTASLRTWCEEGRTVWFIGSFNSRDDIVEAWEADGLRIEEKGSYLLERYWFNLYRISI